MTGHAPTVAAVTVYAGRHRGTVAAPIRISPRTHVAEGLWRYENPDTGTVWWSIDGNYWHVSAEDAARAARQAS